MRKPAIIALTAGITVVATLACLALVVYLWSRPYDLRGPESPDGLSVVVHVSDCGLSWSADYYCDVEIRDSQGNMLISWRDDEGQVSKDGARMLADSMHWTNPTTLQFLSNSAPVTLNVPRNK